MRKIIIIAVLVFVNLYMWAQEIHITEMASLEQVFGETTESETLLPFNDLDMEFGYVLYQTEIEVEAEEAELELENVRDYAVVYLNDKLQGTVTDNSKKLILNTTPGKYNLKLYAENIGRITYGPEILDNSKGLFGGIKLEGAEVDSWRITPLNVKDCDVNSLQFTTAAVQHVPCFYKGYFELSAPKDTYLNVSGWGMGEVWINGQYMGSYWEEEKQQSIQISQSSLKKGKNEVVIFDLKNNRQQLLYLSTQPIFK